ncbi:histidine kinase [Clostridiales bacterium PH28_bin88]|nr:histidine kinase [Clostridiales bacterium PH28_bin88]
MKIFSKPIKIQNKITLLSFGLVLLSVLIGGATLVENFYRTTEREIGSRALAIARTLAQMESIQNAVGKPGGAEVIQPIAEKIRLATNVEYIVVFDMQKIRYSHPVQKYIGQTFVGGDEDRALANHEYISRAEGVLGPSVRAFVPIKTDEGTKQVGVVVVGVLTPTFTRLLHEIRFRLYLSLVAGLAVGFVGSVVLARNIKRAMFDMEPVEIARLLEERVAVFHSIGEGIIAIDHENRVTIINDEAKRIMGIEEEVVGRPIQEVIPDSHLPYIVATGVSEYDRERLLNRTTILANRFPIRVKGEIVGAVATFRDKTEVAKLAEELTGVKKFIEALRVQNHEHMNKLHTIAGLIQLKKYQEAVDYIFAVTEEQEELTQFLTERIRDYRVAGILLGKYSRAKELHMELEIARESSLRRLPRGLDSSAMVIIIGNLLENAMEAVQGLPPGRRKVRCSLKESPGCLHLLVEDQGLGIPESIQETVFQKGFSTKGRTGRGFGLALVKEYVELAGGCISIRSRQGEGTRVEIDLPV